MHRITASGIAFLFLTATATAWPTQSSGKPILVRTLTGNPGIILCLAVSPDGKTLVSGGGTLSGDPNDRTIKFWDVASGKETASFDGQLTKFSAGVRTIAFSSNGKLLASAGEDQKISIWDAGTLKRAVTLDSDDAIWSVAFSPKKNFIASTTTVLSNNPKTNRPAPFGIVKLWDLDTNKSIATFELGAQGYARMVTFSPDGNVVASAGPDSFIRLWDIDKRQKIKTIGPHSPNVGAIAFSPDGTILASGAIVNSKPAPRKQGVGALQTALVPAQQEKTDPLFDRSVRLWDAKTGHPMLALAGHSKNVRCIAFSPDGKTLASASMDATVRLWDVATGNSVAVMIDAHAGGVTAVVFSPDGKWLASAGHDKTIKIWEIKR